MTILNSDTTLCWWLQTLRLHWRHQCHSHCPCLCGVYSHHHITWHHTIHTTPHHTTSQPTGIIVSRHELLNFPFHTQWINVFSLWCCAYFHQALRNFINFVKRQQTYLCTQCHEMLSFILKSPPTQLFVHQPIQASMKEEIKSTHCWPFVWRSHWSTVDSSHKGSVKRKAFSWHNILCSWMKSSMFWVNHFQYYGCTSQPITKTHGFVLVYFCCEYIIIYYEIYVMLLPIWFRVVWYVLMISSRFTTFCINLQQKSKPMATDFIHLYVSPLTWLFTFCHHNSTSHLHALIQLYIDGLVAILQ